ncbi:MAG: NAD(P)-dependent alcohol dehydrogenase [Eubacteriales bacterium]|nr:NAD(P)-dependent alcohol dehydrogenase [Eubacteriales bacterium]
MKAAVLYGKKDIRIQEVKRPVMGPDEVLIQIKAVGICGSDVHYYENFAMGSTYQMTEPQILGHEPSGMIIEVGENVTTVKPGDRVTIEPGETCGRCCQCKSGHYNLCPDVRFLSVPGNKGAFAEYLVMGAEMVYRIPDSMPYEIACLAEPLSVGIHACELASLKPEDKLMVLGAGPIGLMAVAAALSFGVKDITVGDIHQNRLEFAKEYCKVKYTVNTGEKTSEQIVEECTEGKGFDCVIETSGAPAADYITVDLVRKGGRISLVGIPREESVSFHIFDIIDKEVSLYGVFRYANSYPLAVQILNSGIIDFEKLITKKFDLCDTAEALDFALNHKMEAIKTVVVNKEEADTL